MPAVGIGIIYARKIDTENDETCNIKIHRMLMRRHFYIAGIPVGEASGVFLMTGDNKCI